MSGDEAIRISAAEKVGRWTRQSDDVQTRIATAIDTVPVDVLRQIARLYNDEVGYLGEHLPHEREGVVPFACSGDTYHLCSFSTQHDPGCPAAGGNGQLACGYENAKPCASDCGDGDAKPWCHCSGFDCPTCEMVDQLLGLLDKADIGGAR